VPEPGDPAQRWLVPFDSGRSRGARWVLAWSETARPSHRLAAGLPAALRKNRARALRFTPSLPGVNFPFVCTGREIAPGVARPRRSVPLHLRPNPPGLFSPMGGPPFPGLSIGVPGAVRNAWKRSQRRRHARLLALVSRKSVSRRPDQAGCGFGVPFPVPPPPSGNNALWQAIAAERMIPLRARSYFNSGMVRARRRTG